MPHLLARTLSNTLGPRVTFSIRGGSVARGDTFALSTPTATLTGEIESLGPGTFVVRIENVVIRCMPWQFGDQGTLRLPGTSSAWVVEKMMEGIGENSNAVAE